MTRMKIALVNVFFPPQSIGGATRVVSDNLDVMLETHAEELDLVAFTTNAAHVKAHSLDAYSYRGIRVYRAGALWRPNMDWSPRDPAMARLFADFLDFERPDLVHFHCVQRLTGSIVDVTRRRGTPYVVTAHDAWWISDFQFLVDPAGRVYPRGHADGNEPTHLPEGINPEQSIERRSWLRNLLNGAAAVLPVSRSFAEIYRAHGIKRVTAVPNGVSATAPRKVPRVPREDGRVVIGHVGGMSAHKGYDLLREVVQTANFRNLSILIADHSREHGHRRLAEWGTTPVTYLGRYPQERIHELYAQIDVLAAPSIWPESFGLVTREAALAGRWVVASDIGAIGEHVRHGVDGFRVRAGDRDSLRQTLSEIDADPERFLTSPPASDHIPHTADQVAQLLDIYRSARKST